MNMPILYQPPETALLELAEENQPLYDKYIDVVRSGNTRILTNDEFALLARMGILGQNGMNSRTGVIPTTIETLIYNSLGESLNNFLGDNGYIAVAQREFSELVEMLRKFIESGETIADHPEFSSLIKYHLVFERFSDGQLDINIIARTYLSSTSLKDIVVGRTSES